MIAWYCLQTFPLIYPWFWIVLIAVGKLHKTFTKWLTKDCDGHFRSFRELLRSWTTTWWLFWWLGSPYLGTFSAPRHHGPHAHRENLRVCQCLSSFFIIQIAFVFHTCIVNIYVNITNSWFMQCLGGCFLCVSSHSNGETHTHTFLECSGSTTLVDDFHQLLPKEVTIHRPLYIKKSRLLRRGWST